MSGQFWAAVSVENTEEESAWAAATEVRRRCYGILLGPAPKVRAAAASSLGPVGCRWLPPSQAALTIGRALQDWGADEAAITGSAAQ